MAIHLNSKISRRHFLGSATFLSLSAAIPSFSSETETWAFLSDTHIDKDPNFTARGTNMADNLTKVVAEVMKEKDKLTGVLIDGDCAFNTGLKGDYEVLSTILEPIIAAGLPLHMTMGNHDDRGPFYDSFSNARPSESPVESKHAALFETAHANFLFLDSLRYVNKVEGEFGEAQLKWLATTLDAHPDKPAILVGHHYPQEKVESDKPVRITGLVDTDAFYELIEKRSQAKAYLFGHSHNWQTRTDGSGFHQINLPPTAYLFNPDRPNGWVRGTVSPAGIKLELVALDKSHPEHGQVKELAWR